MGKVFSLGFQFAAAIILFAYAGLWADRRFDSSPWGVLVGAFIGFGAGVYALYRATTGTDPVGKPPAEPGSRP